VNFGSEPGRDDGGLPPANIDIPDDARELDRDVLAYHRELRAARRRKLLLRLVRPFRAGDFGGHTTVLPLIATCVALSMLAGAMLSVVTISPASAPTLTAPPPSAIMMRPGAASPAASGQPGQSSVLPPGTVRVGTKDEPVRTLVSSALALVPANCSCGPQLARLAGQAKTTHTQVYFVGVGKAAFPQIPVLVRQDGQGTAAAATDTRGVLGAAYRPSGLTVLLVHSDATVQVPRDLRPNFDLTPMLRALANPAA
jgi:hypothetical protein